MISVAIVGNGNVAFHLYKAFSSINTLKVSQVNSRSLDSIEPADVTIIAVSDDAIPEVSSKIKNSLVVHTSGTTDMNGLQNITRKGVFYPLQSFSKDKAVDFTKVPFCLEVEHTNDMYLLEKLVEVLKGKAYHINSEQRKNIHVAAVFANNFTNYMYQISKDICDTHSIPFDILLPLIEETSEKIKSLTPDEAQTGPAKRNDEKTIKNHLNLLSSSKKEIYQKLTESIQKHGKKL